MKTKLFNLFAVILLASIPVALFVFFAYWNFNWFPEKEQSLFVVKVYYQNGRESVASYKLPASTKLWLVNDNPRSNLLSIWYHNNKPFGMKYGYLEMGVNDFKLLKVVPVKP